MTMNTGVLDVENSPFEEDYWVRRADTFNESYALPVVPYDDEALEDLLLRAACENGYHPNMSYKLLGINRKDSSCVTPGVNRFDISAQALTTLIGNPGGIAEIEHLLHNEVAPRVSLRPFFDTWIDSRNFTRTRRVSPRALAAKGYLRAMWRLWPITYDPKTKEMLLTQCPVCEKSLKAAFMGDVWCCDRCAEITDSGKLNAVDLRDYKQDIVPEDLWDGLDFVTSFVDPTALAARAIARSQLHSDFAGMTDGEVFDLAIAMARCMIVDDGWRKQHMEVEVLHRVSELIRAWPQSLEDVVAAGAFNSRRSPFRNLPYKTSLNVAIRGRMKVLNRISRVARKVSRATASSSSIADDTLSLRAKPEVRSFSTSVGLPVATIADMADGNLFPKGISEAAFIDFADCARNFSDRLNARVLATRVPRASVSLARAVVALQTRIQDPWPVVFAAIFDGRLQVWRGRRYRTLVDDLLVSDFRGLAEIISIDRRPCDDRLDTEISYLEAHRWTRLAGLFYSVIGAGLIKPPFTRRTVCEFRDVYEAVNLTKVRLRLGGSGRSEGALGRELLAAGFAPVLKHGQLNLWHRKDIESHFGEVLHAGYLKTLSKEVSL